GDLLYPLWTGKLDKIYPPDNANTWPWRVLVGETWTKHGAAVASSHKYFPGSFDRVPRNPCEKINSGYKAKEWQHWLFGLAPALLYGILPPSYWRNYCRLTHVVRLLHQRKISAQALTAAYGIVLKFTYEFEELYYQRRAERLHFVRQSIHTPTHLIQEVERVGNPILYAQWTMERMIGNLGREIRQHSNMYANLSKRGLFRAQQNALLAMDPTFGGSSSADAANGPRGSVNVGGGYQLRPKIARTAGAVAAGDEEAALKAYLSSAPGHSFNEDTYNKQIFRVARLALPEGGQVARSRFRENQRSRITRMVKIESELPEGFEIGEVLYYFQYSVGDGEPSTLAMVSVFGIPDREILQESFGTVWIARQGEAGIRVIRVQSIQSVVAMIPFPKTWGAPHEIEQRFAGSHFLYERLGLGSGDGSS
ncbi:hypothetical protein FB45DRAFT_57243, partial [Roridomyces roridus]